jgi:hypothetical protein
MTVPPLPASSEMAASLLTTMRASGKPRGLTWDAIDVAPMGGGLSCVFANEREGGQPIALVLITVQFAAIPGGEMEQVEAVPETRTGTAILRCTDGQWRPTGRILFNVMPAEARERLGDLLRE